MHKNSFDIRKLTYLSLMTALVVVLQFLGGFIHFGPFSVSLVLLPIIVGAALCGSLAGAWLGLVFAAMVFATGDAAAFLTFNPFGTVVTVLVKGVLAGLASGLVYALLVRANKYLAVYAAAVVSPVVNTGIFLVGCRLFFWELVSEWAASYGFANATSYIFLGLAGGNFLFELGLNVLLAPAIVTLLGVAARGGAKRKQR